MNEDRLDFARKIPVKREVDVFVAGGGPSGVAAATVAARMGCDVYLVEVEGCLGGQGTAGLVPAFMQFTDGINFLAGGLGEEILERLESKGGTGPGGSPAGAIGVRVEVLKRVYDELLLEAGVDFTLRTRLIGIEQEGEEVTHAVLAAKSGLHAVQSRVFIDCTGDGDLAFWAGAPAKKGDEDGRMQPGTLCSLWANIDWEKVEKPDGRKLEEAFSEGLFSVEDRHLPGMFQVCDTVGGGNIGHTFGVDGTSEESLTKAFIEGRRGLTEYERYYRRYLDGYEDMELVVTGSLMGIRETRRIMGDYVLNLADFKERAVFEDEIGRYSYPVDIHASKPDPEEFEQFEREFQTLRYDRGESYGIPYRTLTPRNLSNVLVAGRCISTDRYLQGSVRVMPGCFITGQASGVASVLALEEDGDVRGFSCERLLSGLAKMGGYLPNFEQ